MTDHAAFASLCADLLRSGQAVRFTASGASMGPTINDGDSITVVPIGDRGICCDDVVLFTSERGLTAHRIIESRTGLSTWIAMGDAPGSPRELIESASILGRVESAERSGVRLPVGGPFGPNLIRLCQVALRLARRTVRNQFRQTS